MHLRGLARIFVLGTAFALSPSILSSAPAAHAGEIRGNPSDDDPADQAAVTVYGAAWCGACHALEQGLREKQIPFEIVDVDKNPSAYAYAKKAAGAGNSIPLTGVARKTSTQWVVGANVAAVEKAYKGE
jgi:mycoredoxin